MYVIAVLVFLKVFQFRHPDIAASATIIFYIIAAALITEFVALNVSNIAFWVFFIMAYLFLTAVCVFYIYYNGTFTKLKSTWLNFWRKKELKELRPNKFRRFLACLVVVIVNVVLAAFFLSQRKPGVSRYLLLILIGNMTLYVMYYACMKIAHKTKNTNESISVLSKIYFIFFIVFGAVGFYFFLEENKDQGLSPAGSRLLNRGCKVFFFDNHDIWHFCSAGALFFIFLSVLTLEDNNFETPWSKIRVF